MVSQKRKPAADSNRKTTRDRILHAAVQRFANDSYEATALRDLAADVGVDVAYVHRCFGSKEKLFGEALLATVERQRAMSEGNGDFVAALAKEMLRSRSSGEVHPLSLVIRSFSSPEASRALRDFIKNTFAEDIRRQRPNVSDKQASMVAAVVAGVGILRDVIVADALLDQTGEDLETMIVRTLEAILVE